jgi:exonuclease III
MKKHISILISLFLSYSAFSQITKVGNDTLTDIGCWNVEWFGDATNGPDDETLQFNNVKNIIQKTDVDVWGLCEVSSNTKFDELLTSLTAYDGVNSTFSQTQKMAMIWKKAQFDLISSQNISDPTESNFNFAFASRAPLEVVLKTRGFAIPDTLYFYVVHMKANSGSADQASYDRRKDASTYLKKYLDNTARRNRKVIVLGDYNDDIDQSVVSIGGSPLATPFANFINDSAKYFFPSLQLSKNNETSYPGFNPPNMIDHQLNSRVLSDSFYVKNSATVLKQLGTQVTNYINSTSDHYPVFTRYNFKRYLKTGIVESTAPKINVIVYPNPASNQLYLAGASRITNASIYNLTGQLVHAIENINNTDAIAIPAQIQNGLYLLVVQTPDGLAQTKFHLIR